MTSIHSVILLLVLSVWFSVEGAGARGPQGGCADPAPVVRAPAGAVRGALLTSRRGRAIYAFRGLRYAEPPVGPLRFQPPVLVERYAGEVDGSAEGPGCPQPADPDFPLSEDCLRLNVYSPRLPGNSPRRLLPVLVFIHPGGFYSGTGQSMVNGPQYLLDHDILLVSINYRLGSLGFISTGDRFAPGNLGFKDQVAALRWVRTNIAAFGGDPARVTVGGYSAGGISVSLLILSPMAKGLFHQAIAMSDSSMAQWPVAAQPHLAAKQARILGCPDTSSQEIMACLGTKTWRELGDSLLQFYEFGYDPTLIWTPVVENDYGQERFLTEDPTEQLRSGRVHDVPLMTGMTELEFSGQAFTVLNNATLRETMDQDWDEIAPISFVLEREPPRSALVSRRLRSWYLGARRLTFTNDTAYALGRLYGDALVAFSVHRFANLAARHLQHPVYYYKFNYTGSSSHYYYPGTTRPIGAVHHDDLLYLFNRTLFFPAIGLDSPHSFMVDRMTTMWTNFVKTGNPNPTVAEGLAGPVWPRMTPGERQFLQINADLSVGARMFEDRFKIWDELYPVQY